MKLFLLAVLGVGCLLVITGWLVYLNWSPRIWASLLSAFVVGSITAIFSIVSTMKETVTTERFVTFLLTNRDDASLNLEYSSLSVLRRFLPLSHLFWMPEKQINPQFKVIVDEGKIMDRSLAVEQYYITKQIAEITEGGLTSISLTAAGMASWTSPINPLTQSESLSADQLNVVLKSNMFWQLSTEEHDWTPKPPFLPKRRFRVPPGTSISLYDVPSSPQTGPERRGIKLIKPNFFVFDVQLGTGFMTQSLPEGLKLTNPTDQVPLTIPIIVTISVKFESISSSNQMTEEYKNWAAWLTKELKTSMADG